MQEVQAANSEMIPVTTIGGRTILVRRSEAGVSMIQLLFVVILGLMIVGGAYRLWTTITAKNRLSDAQQAVGTIRANIQHLYTGSPDFSGLDNATATNAGVFPLSTMRTGGVRNPWDGNITVAPGAPNTQFTIVFTGVPQEACIPLATHSLGTWSSITVGATAIPQNAGAVAAASGACVAGVNNITWTSTNQ